MSVIILAPTHSFVQFSESDSITSCNFADTDMCLPVYADDDVSFQFVLQTDTEGEADDLSDVLNSKVALGIVQGCNDGFLIAFDEKPERFRIGPRQLLYNWTDGVPGFQTVISRGECFMIKILVDDTYSFCSNCFQRIGTSCHTSVIEYGNDENFGGFNYCNSEGQVDPPAGEPPEPTFIQFTNIPSLVIPYTAMLADKYGLLPSVQTWIYDENNVLVDMGIRVSFDAYPPTTMSFDFGGNASGVIKIL